MASVGALILLRAAASLHGTFVSIRKKRFVVADIVLGHTGWQVEHELDFSPLSLSKHGLVFFVSRTFYFHLTLFFF